MTDPGLKKKHRRMTPIEHFLIDIIQILFRDWIENTIADIGRREAATDIFRRHCAIILQTLADDIFLR